jgi:hypothetical protein
LLPRRGSEVRRPDDIRQQPPPAARAPVRGQQLGDVGDERGGQRQVALLIRAAIREVDALGGTRHGRVEQVPLGGQRVLARAQRQPGRERHLAASLVGEKRLGT